MLVVIPDRYGFEFSIKAAGRKHRTEDSTHIQETEIIDNRKVPKPIQSYLGNSNDKTSLVKQVFQKWRDIAIVLTSSQTIYLTNFHGATDRVTS